MQVLGKTMVMAPGKRTIQIQENDWGGSELKEFIKLSSEFGPGSAVSLVFLMLFLRKDGGRIARLPGLFLERNRVGKRGSFAPTTTPSLAITPWPSLQVGVGALTVWPGKVASLLKHGPDTPECAYLERFFFVGVAARPLE